MSFSFLQIDTARARDLADLVWAWDAAADSATAEIAQAEALSDLPTGTIVQLDQIASDGRTLAIALRRAVDEVEGYVINNPDGGPPPLLMRGGQTSEGNGPGGPPPHIMRSGSGADVRSSDVPVALLVEPLVEAGFSFNDAHGIIDVALRALADGTIATYQQALTAALADFYGMGVDEYLRFVAAYNLHPGEAAAIIGEHFDAIAALGGATDRIDLSDLRDATYDETLPPAVRAAATRLASDGDLFRQIDVAAQTKVRDGLYSINLDISKQDGFISRADLEQFPLKHWQLTTLGPWSILLDTAHSDYQLDTADRHVSDDDIEAFLADPEIPDHIKAAARSVYLNDHTGLTPAMGQAAFGFVPAAGFATHAFAPPATMPRLTPPRIIAPPVTIPPSTPTPGPGPLAYLAAIGIGWTIGDAAGAHLRDRVYGTPTPPDTIEFPAPNGLTLPIPIADLGRRSRQGPARPAPCPPTGSCPRPEPRASTPAHRDQTRPTPTTNPNPA